MPEPSSESPHERGERWDNLDALYEHATCGYIDTDLQGTILRANQTFLRWTGYDANELPGRLFRDLLTTGGRIFHDTHLAPLLAMQGRVDEIALDIVSRVQPNVPVLANIIRHPGTATSAGLHRVVLFRADDRRAYERELLAARREAEEAASAKAGLLMTLSHDVRIPLHVMLGTADLLQQSTLTPEQQEYVEILTSSVENLLALVDQILAFNAVESGALKNEARSFDLQQLVGDVVSSFAGVASQKGLDFRDSVDSGLAEVLGNPMVVRHVLTNLVANAIKSTDRGGIAVRARIQQESRDDIWVEFDVEDSGAGIAARQLAQLTETFGDVTDGRLPDCGRSGMGLAICRWLLSLSGGKLHVTSVEGQGSRFAFTLRFGRLPALRARKGPS